MQAAESLSDKDMLKLVLDGVKPLLGLMLSVLGFLITGIVGLIGWIYKASVKQFKEQFTAYREERKQETEVFRNRFEAINQYMSDGSSRHAVHHEQIGQLDKKVEKIQERTDEHGRIIQAHAVEIKNLKGNV